MLALPRVRVTLSARHLINCRRSYASASNSDTVELAYDLYTPEGEADSKHGPIVFMHGLFGSKKNNRTMSKILVRALNRPVYNIDLRNHGDSPHHPAHNYTAMAADVEAFLATHKIANPAVIGHSMGAKVAMALCLRRNAPISAMVSVDNAPVDAALKSSFGAYVRGMKAISAAKVKKMSEADEILKEYESEVPIRQFLLTNLVRNRETGIQDWRIPVDTLGASLDHMADFPFKEPDSVRWEGDALFVRGTQSHYISDEALPIVGRFFPRFKLQDVDCGHWVISEKPEEFKTGVIDFLSELD